MDGRQGFEVGRDNLEFVEALHEQFLQDPDSVPADWQQYFSESGALAVSSGSAPSVEAPKTRAAKARRGLDLQQLEKFSSLQDRLTSLIRNYRLRGHMIARIDPLGLPRPCPPDLQPEFLGLTDKELDQKVFTQTILTEGQVTVRSIVERLQNTYCRSIGVQYMHIDDIQIRRWLQRRMETTENRTELSREEQLRILTRLTDAVTFEEFIRKKFVGAKSFSLEGCESLIPLLDLAIEKAATQGVKEIVLGMAHRGRLNVLANIMGKSPAKIFREFADKDPSLLTRRGDVKYHLGASCDWTTLQQQKVHLSLCFNPSHLEFVNTVVQGRVRAKQDRRKDVERRVCMAVLIHGDAAFAGEGAVQECLNLSQLPTYKVGGTLHIIINNQVGFTTGPEEARSSRYACDVAKMLQIPIFMVNGEDPEAVAQAVRLAMDFRAEFQQDVVIDMYGYRRLGHNEGDEPSFTQPVLYQAIQQRKPVREGYLDHLLRLGGVTMEEADALLASRRERLEKLLQESVGDDYKAVLEGLKGLWQKYRGGAFSQHFDPVPLVDESQLKQLLQSLAEIPPDFQLHPKLKKWRENRLAMGAGEVPLDWAAAEALAFASLAMEGRRIRFTGQDVGRGTFSHRHALLYDYSTGEMMEPFQRLAENQGPVEIRNSPLSETGVVGFEYGYSLDCPAGLILWEAQFGDFCNAAQVLIDQFIVSGEEKWNRLSALVLLLPHGLEGQGPEHSSARLERFLSMAASDNIQVVYPTEPAQYYHMLRRQVHRPLRKPLIVMTPKSLLRYPQTVSPLAALANGKFEPILTSAPLKGGLETARQLLICTGKIFYELDQFRRERKLEDVAIVRIEELYPFPEHELQQVLTQCSALKKFRWVQEEPENMGAWPFLFPRFLAQPVLGKQGVECVSRPAAASPATGSHNSHKQEQAALIEQAFL